MALVADLCGWDAPSTSSYPQELAKASAWSIAHAHLEPRDIATTRSAHKAETPAITNAFKLIREQGDLELLLGDFWDAVERRWPLVERDIKRFENRWSATAAVSAKPQTDTHTLEMIERLAMWQRAWGMPLKALGDQHSSQAIASFTSAFHQRLHHALPPSFPIHLRALLANSLTTLTNLPSTEPFAAPSPHLNRLGIITRYSAMLSSIAHDEIERIVLDEASKRYTERRLPAIRARIKVGVARWLAAFFEANEQAQQTLRPMFARFDYHACKTLFDARIGNNLFDIIVRYPDSMPALEDLKECLFKVDQRAKLVDSLLAAHARRLLHPGPDTKDVIDHYIKTIRCLRILDPQGVLLHKIAIPLRQHLRERRDTVKCIVAALVDSSGLANDEVPAEASHPQRDESVEDYGDPKWDPEPVDAAPEFRSGRTIDIVSSLMSIYDSHEVIVNELQVLLAGRLLALESYDAVKEIETVELLKVRFGESTLQICDVMLKDIADSERIDKHIRTEVETIVHPLVISRMFWPPIQPSSVILSPRLIEAQWRYETAFHQFKPDKRLHWLQQIGTVTVKVELEDRVLDLRVSLTEATIIELFETQDTWRTDAIATRLNLFNPIQLRNSLLVLAGHGLLREDPATESWILCERSEDSVPTEMPESAETQPFIERTVELQPFWPMIQASLSGLGPQNTQEIHSVLQSMAPNFHYSVDELGAFLANLQLDGALSLHSGLWSHPT